MRLPFPAPVLHMMLANPLRSPAVPVVLLASLLAAAPGAMAQPPTARCIEDLTDAEVEARYRTVYRALEAQESHGRWWYFGWLSVFSGLATAQSILAARDVGGARPRHVTGAIGTGLSVVAYTILPRFGLDTAFAARRLRRHPSDTAAERRDRLRYAEALLERTAAAQTQGTGVLAYGQGFAFGLVASLTLGLRYDDTTGALQFALASPAVNGLRVVTAPTGSIRAWESYRHATQPCMAPTLRRRPRWHWSVGLGHLAVGVRWL
ncbi:MAG: hypothetical protein ACODAU_07825 [Myxococcota bacterium]